MKDQKQDQGFNRLINNKEQLHFEKDPEQTQIDQNQHQPCVIPNRAHRHDSKHKLPFFEPCQGWVVHMKQTWVVIGFVEIDQTRVQILPYAPECVGQEVSQRPENGVADESFLESGQEVRGVEHPRGESHHKGQGEGAEDVKSSAAEGYLCIYLLIYLFI